jgi:ABC-type branched-subunit amino acid transport system substrate-binding protein
MTRGMPRGRRSGRIIVLPVAGVAALTLVAACGSNSSGTSSGGSGGTVHFAALAPLTGSFASLGQPIVEGTKTAASVINAAGGILGKKLVIDPVDTKGDPADAVTALNQEVALNSPAALIGPVTLEIHGVQPIFDRDKIPDGWQGGSAEYDHNNDPYLWRCNPSDSQEGVAIAAYAISKGYKRAAMLFTTSAATQSFEPIIESIYKKLGGQIVSTQSITAGLSSYRSEVQSIISAHPQVIFTQMEAGTAATAFRNFQQLGGLNVPFIGTDLMAGSDVIKAIGPSLSKAHMVEVQGSNALTGAAGAFSTAYQKVNGHAPDSGASFAYDCTIDFALAITKAHSFSGPAIVKQMMAVSNPPGVQVSDYATGVRDIKKGIKIDYQGVSGPLDFNSYHNVTGAWDVVQATGDSAGNVTVLHTITGAQIEKTLSGG